MIEHKRLTHNEPEWQGYSLNDLRYQRAVTLARLEIAKEKLVMQGEDIRSGAMSGTGVRGLLGKVMSNLSYLDYILLAFRMGRTISRAFKGFRRK